MRALALVSGGLDSILAARVARDAGAEVIGLNFNIPFYAPRKTPFPDIGIEIRNIDISEEFLGLLANPRYGFGSQMNPCIDCKILMMQKAGGLFKELAAHFIVTGEVLGQRPMSQHLQALELIPKQAGVEGLVVRPLCAKHLPQTIPEEKGWIDRSKLLNFSGRGRAPQIALARRYGIENYSQPAGGCLLTDPIFAGRLKELTLHGALTLSDVRLLKLGRHLRINSQAKLIVGRDEKENNALLQEAKEDDHLFFPDEKTAGPTSLARGGLDAALVRLCAGITAYFCDRGPQQEVTIQHKIVGKSAEESLTAKPPEAQAFAGLRI